MRDDDKTMSPLLRRAIAELREEPEPRAEWLTGVLDAAAHQRIADVEPVIVERRWSLRPSVAMAAGLAFAAVGAGLTYAAMKGASVPTVASTAAVPLTSTVRFALVAPNAVSVTLVGDFNKWDPKALPMRRSANGETWEVEVGLPPGRYTYAFVVDGRIARDPSAAEAAHDDFGAPSSVLLVKGS